MRFEIGRASRALRSFASFAQGIRSRKRDTLNAKLAKYRKARKAVSSPYRLVKTRMTQAVAAPLAEAKAFSKEGRPRRTAHTGLPISPLQPGGHLQHSQNFQALRLYHPHRVATPELARMFQLLFELQFTFEVSQIGQYFSCGLITNLSILAQRLAHNFLQLRRHVAPALVKRRWLAVKNGRNPVGLCLAAEWRIARYHFVKQHTKTENIRTRINRLATHLLGRHIADGSENQSGPRALDHRHRRIQERVWSCRVFIESQRPANHAVLIAGLRLRSWIRLNQFGDSKIKDLHQPVGPDYYILRLYVSVDDTGLVGGLERRGNLDTDLENRRDRFGRSHVLAQRLAVNIFGSHVVSAVRLTYVEDRYYVRMVEGGCCLCLPHEAHHSLLILSEFFTKHLQRDLAIEPRVFGKVHVTHPSHAKPL